MMQTNSCKGTVYVVKEKDSLYKIAKAHGVRVKDIMRQNPFVNVYNLQIGDELCVPGFTNVIEGAFIPYVVKKGETILDIAKMHKTTVENLAKSNKDISDDKTGFIESCLWGTYGQGTSIERSGQ